jgi:hypothetical protein
MSSIPGRLAAFLCGQKDPCTNHVKEAQEVYDEMLVIQKNEREEEAKKALERLAAGHKIP